MNYGDNNLGRKEQNKAIVQTSNNILNDIDVNYMQLEKRIKNPDDLKRLLTNIRRY